MNKTLLAAVAASASVFAGASLAATVTTTATAEITYYDAGLGSSTSYADSAFTSGIDTSSSAFVTGTDAGTDYENGNPFDWSSPDGAGAIQIENGVSLLEGGGAVASGQSPAQYTATATQTITETNTSGAALDFSLDYSLTGMSFYLNGDYGGAAAGPNPFTSASVSTTGARFSYEVLLNGTSIFSAGIEAFGGSESYSLDNANNATATVNPIISFGFGDGAVIDIDDIIGSLDLGTFADGETFTVETILTAEAIANGYENITYFRLGDPTGLNAGTVAQGSTPITPGTPAVPLPAAAWMLLAGVGGLGALARKRKS